MNKNYILESDVVGKKYWLTPIDSSQITQAEVISKSKTESISIDVNLIPTKNPLSTLEIKNFIEEKTLSIPAHNYYLLIISVFLISVSFTLNSFFLSSLDTTLVNLLALPSKVFSSSPSLNYSVTTGEFKTLAEAKQAAVKFLPSFAQIDIKEQSEGLFVLEIKKFKSEIEARQFIQKLNNHEGLNLKIRTL